MDLTSITNKALKNEALTVQEALDILQSPDSRVMEIVAAAGAVRQKYFGKRVKLNYLVNVKSGLCPEDCHYCSQSKVSEAPIPKYPLMTTHEMIRQAERGMKVGASRACLVASGRGPSQREMSEFCDSVKTLKEKHPQLEVCACLGLLSGGQADQLKSAGVKAYNHNINTSQTHYEKICGTHTYQDRLETVEKAQCAGLSSCSGVLVGMGETDSDIGEMAFVLRKKNVDSIPVNFLVAVDRTPLAQVHHLTPLRCLKILALFRLVHPTAELRVSGGREVHLRHLQPLGLMMANSIFIGDYLTTQGQPPQSDLEMIRDLGFQVEGQSEDFIDKVLGKPKPSADLKETASLSN
ncbi:MAG: Biotin synthase [Elusimicrobia bacterium]|nr:Biotin synthase [Elusimicrobiota bacterium]